VEKSFILDSTIKPIHLNKIKPSFFYGSTRMKRGQGSTEYLIILAIVIVIALIVIGVLGGIPGIGSSGKNRASQAYWSNQDVSIQTYSVSAGGTDTVIVRNNNRNTVTVNEVKVNGVNLASSNVLSAGSSVTLTGAIAACSAGEGFTYNANIAYTDALTSNVYNITDKGNLLEGTCAN
jgi:uncharacterized protein (UPF0333 family)